MLEEMNREMGPRSLSTDADAYTAINDIVDDSEDYEQIFDYHYECKRVRTNVSVGKFISLLPPCQILPFF